MVEAWNAWLTWLRKTYPQVRVFRVVERHEDGYPHFHVLLFAAPFIAQKKIAAQWASLLGVPFAVVDIRERGGWQFGVNYCTKYLLKCADTVAAATWWGPRVRPWSASRGLLADKLPKRAPWWDEFYRLDFITRAQVERLCQVYGLTLEVADEERGFYSAVACGAEAPQRAGVGAGRRHSAARSRGGGVRA